MRSRLKRSAKPYSCQCCVLFSHDYYHDTPVQHFLHHERILISQRSASCFFSMSLVFVSRCFLTMLHSTWLKEIFCIFRQMGDYGKKINPEDLLRWIETFLLSALMRVFEKHAHCSIDANVLKIPFPVILLLQTYYLSVKKSFSGMTFDKIELLERFHEDTRRHQILVALPKSGAAYETLEGRLCRRVHRGCFLFCLKIFPICVSHERH